MEKFVGIITKDATTRTIEGDRKVTNFTIAKNRYYVGKDGQRKQRTTFIECADWRNTGVVPYLIKGNVAEVVGEIGVRAYLDKDNQPVGVLTLTVGQIFLHFSKNDGTHAEAPELETVDQTESPVPTKEGRPKGRKGQKAQAVTEEEGADLPF